MGNTPSTPAKPTECPVPHAPAPQSDSKCPVQHQSSSANTFPDSKCPVQHQKATQGGCPVKHKDEKPVVYNVYGERIDPTNMMPYNPNQEPHPQQKYPLRTDRVQSTIPKGGIDGTWLYPSEQMFFNAMKRKGKGEDVNEGDVQTIISIHNNMNERTWKQVVEWEEKLHPGSEPKLLRFMGRPDELTPLARLKQLFGYGTPFDRHDWTVVRKDGTEVRYVIDYYYDEDKSKDDQVPQLHSMNSIKSISVFARPAVDSIEAAVDRVKFPFLKIIDNTEPNFPQREPDADSKPSVPKPVLSREFVEESFSQIKTSCRKHLEALQISESDEARVKAATALQHCMASVVCKEKAEAFNVALEKGTDDSVGATYDAMNLCVEDFEDAAQEVLRAQALEAAAAAEPASK